jgi:ribosomal protein L37AE/L43A
MPSFLIPTNMKENEYTRQCPDCSKEFIAQRADQLFCCNKCRYDFHNRIARGKRKKVTLIDRILHRNREVLGELFIKTKPPKVSQQELLNAGFDFGFHTHSSLAKDSQQKCYYIYEYGILKEADGKFKILQDEKLQGA